jgi:hypothetical protein
MTSQLSELREVRATDQATRATRPAYAGAREGGSP